MSNQSASKVLILCTYAHDALEAIFGKNIPSKSNSLLDYSNDLISLLPRSSLEHVGKDIVALINTDTIRFDHKKVKNRFINIAIFPC